MCRASDLLAVHVMDSSVYLFISKATFYRNSNKQTSRDLDREEW